MNANFASFLYLVSGILFILALRGLSHPTTSRQGNIYGMIGMGIAIVTTLALATPTWGGFALIALGLAIGGVDRRHHRAAHRHDRDAAAGRRLPHPGRPCRRDGRGRGDVFAGELRHRHASATSTARRWSR